MSRWVDIDDEASIEAGAVEIRVYKTISGRIRWTCRALGIEGRYLDAETVEDGKPIALAAAKARSAELFQSVLQLEVIEAAP